MEVGTLSTRSNMIQHTLAPLGFTHSRHIVWWRTVLQLQQEDSIIWHEVSCDSRSSSRRNGSRNEGNRGRWLKRDTWLFFLLTQKHYMRIEYRSVCGLVWLSVVGFAFNLLSLSISVQQTNEIAPWIRKAVEIRLEAKNHISDGQ